jgi:hypothetical protein
MLQAQKRQLVIYAKLGITAILGSHRVVFAQLGFSALILHECPNNARLERILYLVRLAAQYALMAISASTRRKHLLQLTSYVQQGSIATTTLLTITSLSRVRAQPATTTLKEARRLRQPA